MLETLEEVANFHDQSANALNGDLSNSIKGVIKNKLKEREDITRSMAKLEADLAKASEEYDKVWMSHVPSFVLLFQVQEEIRESG